MPELIDRHDLLKKVYEHPQERERMTDGEWCRKCIYEAPKVESAPVRHGQKWIPCSERLPEIGDEVIVYYSYCERSPIQVAHLQYDGMTYELSNGEYNLPVKAVTHWMPLPSTEGLT